MASLNLKDELREKEEKYHNSDAIFGITLLTNPAYVSAGRSLMWVAHSKQFMTLEHPEVPKMFTNYENAVGDNSTGYYESAHNYKVIKIIPRFKDGVHDKHLYCMVVYDKKTDTYDIITKELVEDLTEKFGFAYNNEVLDSKEEGDKISKGDVLYKTTSYDDDMNYCYGRNATVMYTIDNRTLEDAIVCSKSFAQSTLSKEVETVEVAINDNDVLCNLYGDKSVYKGFPDIGNIIKNKMVCARRRIHNSQILYDLKASNLRKVNFASDTVFFNSGRLVDIHILSNKQLDELPDTPFNAQIKHYLKMQTEFYTELYDICDKIINSGSKYSNDIGFYHRKAKNILDPSCVWKEENGSVFSNLLIRFTFERSCPLEVGSKLTGRYGKIAVFFLIAGTNSLSYDY